MVLTALVISVAVSLDGLAVGAAYALRRIRLGAAGLVIIGATSTAMVAVALAAGSAISPWLPPACAERLGGILLMCVGLSFLVQRTREPAWADRDRSGVIDPSEALVLGLALAMDAFAAGLAAAIGGWAAPWLPVAVGLAQMAFVFAGRAMGSRALAHVARRLDPVPALVLIILGVARLL